MIIKYQNLQTSICKKKKKKITSKKNRNHKKTCKKYNPDAIIIADSNMRYPISIQECLDKPKKSAGVKECKPRYKYINKRINLFLIP
jgi:hypothetical protein